MINLNDLKNEIIMIPLNEPVFLYIGVGTAAREKQHLPLEHYQQFPPFLQEMRNQVPNLHLFLLLIDPYQENPPYVATDYNLQESSAIHYRDADGLLQIFVSRCSVYTDADLHALENALNITPVLRDLNQFAVEKQISLLYHDFTGRKTALLAEYFDGENKEHLDQIIYGMSGREDHGCFFDLTEPTAYFPYKLDRPVNRRPVIKMFNYYKYCVNQTYHKSAFELESYPKEMHPLAIVQKEQIIQVIRNQFKNTNLSLLRQVRRLLLEAEHIEAEHIEAEHMDYANYIFNELPKFYREMFTDLLKEKEYDLLYELLFNYTATQLDIVVKMKEIDMSGEELLTFITLDEDPYKWYNNSNKLF
jgi:hypothetical protein